MNKVFGIIGGNGVAATNKLLTLVENIIVKNGAKRDFEHPEMIIWQATKAPSRSMYYEGRGPSFISDYINIIKNMQSLGANVFAICCNTAHIALPELKLKTGAKFIDIIEKVVLTTKKKGYKKIGILASDGIVKNGIYTNYFNNLYPQAQIFYPDIELQKQVTLGICNTKNYNRFSNIDNSNRPNKIFNDITKSFELKYNLDTIVLGCTDISVDFYNDKYIDSLQVLASSIVEEYYGN